MEMSPHFSREFCSSTQFDFTNPEKALHDFQGCRGFGSFKDDQELFQRFASGWATFAATNGVGNALRALANPGVRNALLPMDDWSSLVTHMTDGQNPFTAITGSINTVVTLQIITVLAITLSSIFMTVLVWKRLNALSSYHNVERIFGIVTPDLCDRIDFDFTHPRQALAALRACIDLDESRITSLQQRFLTSWAKYSVAVGVGEAIRALADPEVREALIPEEDWLAVVTRPAAAIHRSLLADPAQPTFIAEIVLVVLLTILTAGVAVWTLKLKSLILRALSAAHELPRAKTDHHWSDERSCWEPEEERRGLLEYEPDD